MATYYSPLTTSSLLLAAKVRLDDKSQTWTAEDGRTGYFNQTAGMQQQQAQYSAASQMSPAGT